MSSDPLNSPDSSRWNQNHGNFLLGFLIILLLIGAGLLAYQQSRPDRQRFVPRFEATVVSEDLILDESQAAPPGVPAGDAEKPLTPPPSSPPQISPEISPGDSPEGEPQ